MGNSRTQNLSLQRSWTNNKNINCKSSEQAWRRRQLLASLFASYIMAFVENVTVTPKCCWFIINLLQLTTVTHNPLKVKGVLLEIEKAILKPLIPHEILFLFLSNQQKCKPCLYSLKGVKCSLTLHSSNSPGHQGGYPTYLHKAPTEGQMATKHNV